MDTAKAARVTAAQAQRNASTLASQTAVISGHTRTFLRGVVKGVEDGIALLPDLLHRLLPAQFRVPSHTHTWHTGSINQREGHGTGGEPTRAMEGEGEWSRGCAEGKRSGRGGRALVSHPSLDVRNFFVLKSTDMGGASVADKLCV